MNKEISILEIFAGIGSGYQVLKEMGYKVNAFPIEIDRKILDIYDNLHNSINYTIDVKDFQRPIYDYWLDTKWNIVLIGFPCQDISLAGKQKGITNGTRSNLIWEAIRIIKDLKDKPDLIVIENVKAFAFQKYDIVRGDILLAIEELGYNFKWDIVNANKFGLPQNRERLFIVFKKNESLSKAKIPKYKDGPYKNKLTDFLEYVPIEKWKPINNPYKEYSNFIVLPRAKDGKLINGNYNRLWKTDKYVGTLNGTNQIKITSNSMFYRKYKLDKEIGSLRSSARTDITNWMYTYYRSLTPLECFRLMGWNDFYLNITNFNDKNIPKSLAYKAIGNAIALPVLKEIFKANGY